MTPDHHRARLKPRKDRRGLTGVEEALINLNVELVERGFGNAEAKTILVFDGHQQVNNYGLRIGDDIIFRNFNLNCSTLGTQTTCKISYPHPWSKVPPSHRQGFFVRASDLGITANPSDPEEDFYVAVVNIKSNGDADFHIIHYQLKDED